MSDEGFHEIQLNGKQLVFLFMAATVVFVVVFILGVMVGRGVPAARLQALDVAESTTGDPTADVLSGTGAAAPNSDRTPVSAQESLTYAERLAAPPDTLREPTIPETPPPAPARETPAATAADTAASRQAASTPAVKEPAVAAAATTAGDTSFPEPPGDGHVVQVGAYPRDTAETIARRLASKGYPVFITPRSQGLFAVRVGKYNDRREAETVASRLEQQEQFNTPWVTR